MQAVIDACKAGRLKASIGIVISNNGDSGALARAKQEKIPHRHLSSRTHPIPEQLDEAILETLTLHQIELVISAGYMRKMGNKTLEHYAGRVLNIHPALLRGSAAKECMDRACMKPFWPRENMRPV